MNRHRRPYDVTWILVLLLISVAFAIGILVGLSKAYPCELPADPIRRVAAKAIRGDYDKLEAWQRKAYSLLAEHGVAREGQAYVTHYGPPKFKRGQATAFGWACIEGCWAANNLPKYWYVLVQHPKTSFWEMGWIRDCGASWNDAHWRRVARERYHVTIDLWLDRWTPKKSLTNVSWPGARYYAISAEKTW